MINTDIDLQERIKQTKESFKQQNESAQKLFFMARNGAIAHVLREIEQYFISKNMVINCHWKETSLSVSIQMTLNCHERSILIKRDTIHPEPAGVSPCIYSLERVSIGQYYRSKKPKIAVELDEILSSEEFKGLVENLILGTNYPFTYESYSSF